MPKTMTSPTAISIKKLTPVLVVDAIEPCLSFWTDRLGFEKTVEVPEGDQLGFVILVKDDIEVMYQTWASVKNDIPKLAEGAPKHQTVLYIEVSDVDLVEKALKGTTVVVPRRQTFYGMDEIGVREPGGNLVLFSQPKK
jgi:uncharacterized glyoxalase superfamily protein PhnB